MIAKSGKPIARLVPYETKGATRWPAAMCCKIRIKKNFDESLPKELLASFEESPNRISFRRYQSGFGTPSRPTSAPGPR
ncbi:MAG TPA: hypothetical protein VGW77_13215 [Candidatus Binatia bacterium]|nr:hypothetical protein [Candidatus Binatia bacterium]